MPHYTSEKPEEKIRSLINELSSLAPLLEDEELKNKILPLIQQLQDLLPEEKPKEEEQTADEMLNTKNQDFMSRIMSNK